MIFPWCHKFIVQFVLLCQCESCKAVYHAHCKTKMVPCPRCARRHNSSSSYRSDPIEHISFSFPADHLATSWWFDNSLWLVSILYHCLCLLLCSGWCIDNALVPYAIMWLLCYALPYDLFTVKCNMTYSWLILDVVQIWHSTTSVMVKTSFITRFLTRCWVEERQRLCLPQVVRRRKVGYL